jgi:hypothetical protein
VIQKFGEFGTISSISNAIVLFPRWMLTILMNSFFQIKTLIYLFLAAAEDEETQIRGMVAIAYFMGNTASEFNPSLIARLPGILEWVPLRFSGLHVCFEDPRLGFFKSLLTLSVGQARRARLRIHHGTSSMNLNRIPIP